LVWGNIDFFNFAKTFQPLKKKKKSDHSGKKAKSGKPAKQGSKNTGKHKARQVYILAGIFLLVAACFLLLSFLSYSFGAWRKDDYFADPNISLGDILFDQQLMVENWMGRMGAALAFLFIKQWFGLGSFLFVMIFILFGFRMSFRKPLLPLAKPLLIILFFILLVSLLLGFILKGSEYSVFGGFFGYYVNHWAEGVLGRIGTGLVIGFLILSSLVLVFNISLPKRKASVSEEGTPSEIPRDFPLAETLITEEIPSIVEFDMTGKEEEKAEAPEEDAAGTDAPTEKPQLLPPDIPFTIESTTETESQESEPDLLREAGGNLSDMPFDPTLELSHYRFPPVDLLANYGGGTSNVKKEELEENKNKIVQTLNNYSIQIDKIIATIGPTVTLYEIVPAPGIRISKIKNLEDDIALSLSAYGIRIIAPIPGKGTIGIEVPNQNPETVSMRSVITSERFQNSRFDLPVALGKTISNETYVADLTKMPHLLMAGATGQGKSVGLNAIITSLLYKKHPAEIKFVMVDPKKVELSLFTKIEKHYLAKLPDFEEPIITDTRKVVRALNSMMIEMDQRYNLLKDAQVRNIKEYNVKFVSRRLNPQKGHRFLPYIILVVDEFADLIMTAGKEVETPLTRLAQLARAIGMHLIIATQRPSVNIITGTIKANFPARVAFRVISKIDSRTILDTGGADQLIGRGDMLLSMGSDIIRLQCAFIDTGEIENITAFISDQQGYPHAFHLPEYFEEGDDSGRELDTSERDGMFEEAARLIVQYQQGSTSLIQRKLKLGYNRAGRIMDQLEASGIVGPSEGSKPREVKVKDMYLLEQFLREGM